MKRQYVKLDPRQVQEAVHESFSQKRVPTSTIISMLIDRGVQVVMLNEKNRHFRITGKARAVDFYGNTGTIHAREVVGMFGEYRSQRGMSFERAIERVVSLANVGH